MDEADTVHARANVAVQGGKIVAVGPEAALPDGPGEFRTIDAAGHLLMPGLVNGHFHSPGTLLKGSLDSAPLEIFMLAEVPLFRAAPLPPRVNYICTMMGAMEMLKNGVTAVQDDAYFAPVPTPEGIGGVMQAYVDSGMRARVSLDQGNVVEYAKYPFLEELLPPALRQSMARAELQSTQELAELYRWFIGRWEGACEGRIGTAVSCSAPQRVSRDYLSVLNELSHEFDIPHYIHVLETKLQRVLGEEKYGKSLIRYLADEGALDERCNLIHAIWVDDADIELMAAAGCVVAHNPLCNLRLGSGIMPFRRLRDRGVPVCLGSDEAISDDAINMWAVAKAAGLVHNITDRDYRNWPGANEILHCLINAGARAMHKKDRLGRLAPGYEADLIMLRLDTLSFTPLNNLYRQLVYCENGSSVVMTMVAGEIVCENGCLLNVDEEAIRREACEIVAQYRDIWAQEFEAARTLEPYYREMYLRASQQEVGMQRRLDG